MNKYFYLVNPWWQSTTFDTGIQRPKYIKILRNNIDNKLIQVITGLRRVGKSTIILQLIKSLISSQNISPTHILFFSVEAPPILNTSITDIINNFRSIHNLPTIQKIYVFIDEIQFRQNWEQEIKSLYDTQTIKFILTGSSAMLLSQKLTYLTGRYLKTQVYPLDFNEYLDFKKLSVSKIDTHLLLNYVETYLQDGGMPEYILTKPNRYLETTIESILFKDLVTKFQLRNPKILTDLLYLLADRISTVTSSLKLSKVLDINKDTILTYINYLNKTFITTELNYYSTSRNQELYNPPKIFFYDLGIASTYSSKHNFGASAENAIFNHINNQTGDLLRVKFGYFYANKKEIDFVLTINTKTYFIESKWVDTLDQINFTPLKQILKLYAPTKIIYVTRSLKTTKQIYNHQITFIPLYDFLRKNLLS